MVMQSMCLIGDEAAVSSVFCMLSYVFREALRVGLKEARCSNMHSHQLADSSPSWSPLRCTYPEESPFLIRKRCWLANSNLPVIGLRMCAKAQHSASYCVSSSFQKLLESLR